MDLVITMDSVVKKFAAIINLLRPYQWVKNILVFSGLFFSTSLFKDHTFLISLAAFVIFCMASSGVYVLNDIGDIEHDKLHPIKKNRPIASGKVSVNHAIVIMSTLLLLSLISAFYLEKEFFVLIIIYVAFNISYSFGLKNIVILDAMIVAFGFLIRVFSGCAVIHVIVTPWLFICSLTIALLLSFGKRRNEINLLKSEAKNHRNSLSFYNVQFLDMILTICGATAIATYSLYTMAVETVARFGSQRLIMTTPFVIYGVFRYIYLIYTRNEGGDPTKLLVSDLPTVINGILWFLSVGYVIYGSKIFPIIGL
jgi:4-hydroxybenzoate polyprenyltransferase